VQGESRASSGAVWWAAAIPLAAVLALAHPTARPFHSNQNQYFAHAVGERTPSLTGDWLMGTDDPYPLFTWLAGGVLDLTGLSGIRVWSLAVTAAGVLAVGFVARALTTARTAWPALLAMVVAAISLSPTLVAGAFPNAFQGLAGQYVITGPGYVQPSSAGVALLFTLGLLLRYDEASGSRRRDLLVAAGGTAAIACAIHPTYAVVVVLGAAAAAVVDVTFRTTERMRAYAAVGIASVAAAVLANRSVLSLGSSVSGDTSLSRFAFERIPHHTLIAEWAWNEDGLVVLVIVAAAIAAPGVRHGTWLARWLGLGLAASLAAAGLVWASMWTSLALTFPWRITVILMPLAVAVLSVRSGDLLERSVSRRPRAVQSGLATVMVILVGVSVVGLGRHGLELSRSARDPSTTAPVSLVVEAAPEGVGLIPLTAENVRINARYPVFVDWKSPPYASADLDEWWRRVDEVRAVAQDPSLLCTRQWTGRVDWVLFPGSVEVPGCLRDWPITRGEHGWRLAIER